MHYCKLVAHSSSFPSQHPALDLFAPIIQLACHSFPKDEKQEENSKDFFTSNYRCFIRFAPNSSQKEPGWCIVHKNPHYSGEITA